MTPTHFAAKVIVPLAASLFASAAFAHASLVSSTPADQSEVTAPTAIELTFSGTLLPQFSVASLIKTGASNQENNKLEARVSAGSDGKTLIVTPVQTLKSGDYRVEWRVVASDTHPISGKINFKVK